MPGPFDWLRSKWMNTATTPEPRFTPYAIAPPATSLYSRFAQQPEETEFDRQLAKMRADAEARQADLRALNERLAEKSAALKPMPESPFAGVGAGVGAGLRSAVGAVPLPVVGRLDKLTGQGMEEAFKPRGPAAYLLRKFQEASAASAAREVSPEEAIERNLRMARFGTPPQTPEQFQEGAKLTQEIGDPTIGMAASMGGSIGGLATFGVGGLAGQAAKEGVIGGIGRGAQFVRRPIDALFALEGARQIGHAIGDEDLTWKERAMLGGMGGLMAFGGGKGAARSAISPAASDFARAFEIRNRVMGPTPGVTPPPPGWRSATRAGPLARTGEFPPEGPVSDLPTPLQRLLTGAVERPPTVGPPPGVMEGQFYEPEPPIFSAVPRTVAPGVRQASLETLLERPAPPAAPEPAVPPVVPAAPVSTAVRPIQRVGPVPEPQAPPGTARPFVAPVEKAATPGAAPVVERPVAAPSAAPRDPTAQYVEITDPQVLGIDAKTYQHKKSDVQGVTGALRGVTEWATERDPTTGLMRSASPPILVHELADGRLFVADGFQRYNKYMELRAQGKRLPPLVANVKREVDGWTVPEVRRAAALRNLVEPTTDPLDIAKVLREGPLSDRERATIARANLVGSRYTQGEALSTLGEDAYQMVVTNGLIPPEQGASIPRFLQDPGQQTRAVTELQKRGFATKTEADTFLAELAETPFRQPTVFEGLAGIEQEGILSLVDQKTDLIRQVATGLRRQRAAFSNLLRNAPKVTEAGNVLVGEVNKGILDETRSLLGYFEKYKNAQGSATRRAINVYTERLARGEVEYADAETGIFDAIRTDIESGGAPPPGAVAEPPLGRGGPGELAGREQQPAARVESAIEARPATPEEVPTILDEMKKQIERANKPADTFALERGTLPPPSPKELETEFGQKNLEDLLAGKSIEVLETQPTVNAAGESAASAEAIARARGMAERGDRFEMVDAGGNTRPLIGADAVDVQPGRGETKILRRPDGSFDVLADNGGNLRALAPKAPTPLEELIDRAKVDLSKEQVEVREAVTPIEAQMREVTGKAAPAQVPWTELDRGAVVAPPTRDFAAVRLNEGQTHLAKDLAANGWKYRSKWAQWFKNVTDETREGVIAEAEEILGAAKPIERGRVATPVAAEAPARVVAGEGAKIGGVGKVELTEPPVPIEAPKVAAAPPYPPPPGLEPPPGGPPIPTWDKLKPNEKSFLRERGGLTKEDINEMSIEEAREHGRTIGEAIRKAKTEQAPPAAPITAGGLQVGRRRPLPPEVQEWADLIDAKVKNGELPDTPLQAERIIEVNHRAAERYKQLIVRRAEGVKEGDVVSLLEAAKAAEFTPNQLRAAIELQKQVDNWALQIGIRRNPLRATESEAFPQPERPIRPPQETQHALAQQRAQWLEDGRPDSLQKYANSLRDLQDREFAIQVRNHFTEAKAAPPKKGFWGEEVGEASMGLREVQELYQKDPDKFWRLMGRVGGVVAGGTTGATIEKDDPVRGFIKGALAGWMLTSPTIYRKYTYQQIGKYAKAILPRSVTGMARETVEGRPALRLMPDAARDISLFTEWRPGTPEHQVPELHRAVWTILDEYAKQAATGALSRVTPEVRKIAHARYYKDAMETAREMAEDYTAAGLPHKARYANRLADALALKPTIGQRVWKQGMKRVGVDVDYNTVERIFGQNVYRVMIGWALDSGVANSTQPILGLRHYGPTDLLHGYRMARTPEGIQATAHLRIRRPIDVDTEGLPIVPEGPEPTTLAGKAKAYATDPGRVMGAGDNYNRRVAYLAARRYAERNLRLDPVRADDWAQEVVRTSQGDVGATGFNPLYRGPIMGSVRPFQKFPALFAENMFDTLFQPNKVTGLTFIGVLMGLDFLGKRIGLDISDMLLMGGRVMGIDPAHPFEAVENLITGQTTPAGRALEDVSRHAGRTATHPIGLPGEVKSLEDLLESDLAQLSVTRYPAKVAATAIRFGKYGLGAHMKRTPSGAPDPVTALEDLINVIGLKTTRQTGQTRLLQEMSTEAREKQVAERYHRNEINRLYLQAVERGDEEEAGRLLGQLKTVGSAIAMVKRGQLDRFQRLLQSASPEVRGALEEKYGEKFRQYQVPQ